jgi:hypothetical protein
MSIYQHLKAIALRLVQKDHPDTTEKDLETWIVQTGYGVDAPRPYESTPSLIYVYAANLLNSGLLGPDKRAFGKLASTVINKHYLKQNVLTPIDLEGFAQKFIAELNQTRIQLTKNGNQKYIAHLNNITANKQSTIYSLLISIISFCDLLRDNYHSSAAEYHQSFLIKNEVSFQDIVRKLNEITKFRLNGVAVGMNFMKDSQMPAVADGKLKIQDSGLIQYLVKPDMHVMRFMLRVTQRHHGSIEELCHMRPPEFMQLYETSMPLPSFEAKIDNDNLKTFKRGDIFCIKDIYTIAKHEAIPPIFLDRILYLIGSGSFKGKKLRTSQLERYEAALSGLQPQTFELEFYEPVSSRLNRVKRLIELNAPKEIIAHEHAWLVDEMKRAEGKTFGVEIPYTPQQLQELKNQEDIDDFLSE